MAEDSSQSGSTATLVFVIGRTLFCANVGDSRAILGTITQTKVVEWNVIRLSRDHKPEIPGEMQRIIESKGKVSKCVGIVHN